MAFSTWLKGKRTYILAGVVLVAVGIAVFAGQLTPETAYGIALAALAGFAVTFRAALADHKAEVLAGLQDVAAAGVAIRAHNNAELEAIAKDAAGQVLKGAVQNYPSSGGRN